RRAVRRAPALDPAVRGLAEPLTELGQEARLAEACLADEEDHLAVSRGGALEALAQEIELTLPSDERALAGHVDRGLDTRCPPPDDGVCVQGVGFADAQVARSHLAPGLDAARHRGRCQDLPVARMTEQALGQCQGVSDREEPWRILAWRDVD